MVALHGIATAQPLSDASKAARAGDPPQAVLRASPTRDPLLDGIGKGAAIGALAGIAMGLAQMTSCNEGCDWQSTGAMLLGWSIVGSGAGAAVGLAADADTQGRSPLHGPPDTARWRFFPSRLSPRVGVALTSASPTSSRLEGRTAGSAFAFAVQLSPHISVHTEYLAMDTTFEAAPGAVADEVLQNIVPASTRAAGFSRGIESRRVDYIFSELVGVHLAPWGRVRLELLGGAGVQGQEERAYYDAYRDEPGAGTVPLAGKYYVLNFGSPALGWIVGADAEVAVAGGLRIVPTVRFGAFEDSAGYVSYGAGVHWRF
jgi:hypothetical protein